MQHQVKKVLAIINPISGGKKKNHIPKLLNKYINHHKIELTIAFSKNIQHVSALTIDAVNNNYDAIIAVGGDGTINTIAQHILNTNIALGIIPMGSGNGLSNALGIPKKIVKAVQSINKFNTMCIDCGMVNDKLFLNIAGTGFDALVGFEFNNLKKRGLPGYIFAVVKLLFSFKSLDLTIGMNNQNYTFKKVFMAVVGNGTQFGNNVYITPMAKLNDGLLNLTIVTNINFINALKLIYAVLTKNFNVCKNFCFTFVSNEFIIARTHKEPVNIDGESEIMQPELKINILPNSIKILIP